MDYAYSTATGLLSHVIDYAQPYIDLHLINIYVDGVAFRSALSDLQSHVRAEVVSHVNDAMIGFSTRAQNITTDYNSTVSTSDEADAFGAIVQEYSDKLVAVSNDIITKTDELVQTYALNRPLLRPTGNRSVPTINFGVVTKISYEFQNIGTKPWSGWMGVKVFDEYKNSVSVDFITPSLPLVSPGDTVTLTREIIVDRVQQVNGKSRSWGKKTVIHISIYTRNT